MEYPSVTRGIFDMPLFRHLSPEKPVNPFVHGSQNWRILEALEDGPKTSLELSRIALKYTGRVSDIRKELYGSGWTIRATLRESGAGSVYELVRS